MLKNFIRIVYNGRYVNFYDFITKPVLCDGSTSAYLKYFVESKLYLNYTIKILVTPVSSYVLRHVQSSLLQLRKNQ